VKTLIQTVAVATFVALGAQHAVAETKAPVVGTSAMDTSAAAAAAPAPHHRQHQQQAVSAVRSTKSSDDEAIQQQFQLRVLMPALSGDGA